jgi:hypothetical protein
MVEFQFIDTDDIKPVEIEHKCEELFDGGAMQEKYNYLVYHFDCDGAYFWARTYTDQIGTVSVFGPFEGRGSIKHLPGPMNEAMLSYFKRRFRKIQTLGNAGYISVWSD